MVGNQKVHSLRPFCAKPSENNHNNNSEKKNILLLLAIRTMILHDTINISISKHGN